jgi:S-adenosylmethionine:tRNA ribosyltransferase-isomerase
VIETHQRLWSHARVRDLPRFLRPFDLLVVNDAATVPASLLATTPTGSGVEVRLTAPLDGARWRAVLFGAGDWRTPTELRPVPAPVTPGDALRFGPDLQGWIEAVDEASPRLVVVRFSSHSGPLLRALYRHGRPVQYAHVTRPLEIWHVQTPFADRPWAVEMPSAGRPLSWSLVRALQTAGVRVRSITHAAGLSSTGDPGLDARLPLPERFDVPERTVRAVLAARAEGGRVIAAGTTVVRALEGCAARYGGELVGGQGTTDLRIGPGFVPRVVDGLVTGLHASGSSHRELELAFVSEPLLVDAWMDAEARGYLQHEFGDTCLILSAGRVGSSAC